MTTEGNAMSATTPRLILAGFVALVLAGVCLATIAARDATAATNPRIVGVSLVAGQPFTAGTVVVYGASGVAVCVSGKCVRAIKSQSGIWNVAPPGLPYLVRGQSRQVIVFAASSTGGFSYLKKQVTVR
jgi:hypothetical protein